MTKKLEHKARRKYARECKTARKLLDSCGLKDLSVGYQPIGHCCTITRTNDFGNPVINMPIAKMLMENRIRILDLDTDRYYNNLEEFLILTLAGIK